MIIKFFDKSDLKLNKLLKSSYYLFFSILFLILMGNNNE
jgi:hypothetical protein